MIVSVSGYNYTGSGAVIDLLKEYEETSVIEEEIGFVYLPDGLVDLDYNLNNASSYLNGDVAINRFWNLCAKSSIPQEYRDSFLKATREYLNEITQLSWKGNSSFDGTRLGGVSYYRWILKQLLGMLMFHFFGETPGICKRTMRLAHHPREFKKETESYLQRITDIFCTPGKISVMNQFFSAFTPDKSMKYLQNAKTIIVDRDPRDVYFLISKNRGTNCFPYGSVEQFTIYLKTCWENRERTVSDRVLRIQFEDLIYHYSETVATIERFLDISKHSQPQKYFDPSVSINNTQLFCRFPDQKMETSYIEKNLSKYLYTFPYDWKGSGTFF